MIDKNVVIGLIKLFRPIPVLSFTGNLMFINIAFAYNYRGIQWNLLPLVAGGVLINGFLSHSLNDIYDWESGTDRLSKGILSGAPRS